MPCKFPVKQKLLQWGEYLLGSSRKSQLAMLEGTANSSGERVKWPESLNQHVKFMSSALSMAAKALEVKEVPVGCVFVLNGEIIGSGMNDTNRSLCGIRHAEFVAIEEILERKNYPTSIFEQVDLYVTVEPCVMCASALEQLKVRRVFFGAANDRFGGNGSVLKINSASAYRSYPGFLRSEAIILLRKFYVRENTKAPNPRDKKKRVLKQEEFPVLDFRKYLEKEDFAEMYGESLVHLYDQPDDYSIGRLECNESRRGSENSGAEITDRKRRIEEVVQDE